MSLNTTNNNTQQEGELLIPTVTSILCTPSLVTAFDTNGNGYVDQLEFAQMIARLLVKAKSDASTSSSTTATNTNTQVRAEDCQAFFAGGTASTSNGGTIMVDNSDNSASTSASTSAVVVPDLQDVMDTISCLCLPFHAPDDRSPQALDCCRKTVNGAKFAAPGVYDPAYDALVCYKTNAWVNKVVQQEQLQQQCAQLAQLAASTNAPTSSPTMATMAPTTSMPTASPTSASPTTAPTGIMTAQEQQPTAQVQNTENTTSNTTGAAKPYVPTTNDNETPTELASLPYYEKLRAYAAESNTLLDRPEGSNLDWFSNPAMGLSGNTDPEIIGICHISLILPMTGEDGLPDVYVGEDAAYAALAIQHMNTGDGSLVPQVAALSKTCPIRFTMEIADDFLQAGKAMQHVIEQTSRPVSGNPPRPCAFIGEYWSSNTMPMAIVSGLLGYVQMSSEATSADLDDKSQFPLFARTLPNDSGTAVSVVHYFAEVLKATHLVVINVNDAYGNAFVEGIRVAARRYAPDLKLHQIPIDYNYADGPNPASIEDAVASIRDIRYRFIFGIIYGADTHDQFLTVASEQNVAGDGLHNWFFADSFSGNLAGRTFPVDSVLAKAYEGIAVIEISGGVPGMPVYDKFATQMNVIGNSPRDLEYFGRKLPVSQEQREAGDIPFIHDGNFLEGALQNGYGPLAYEAVIAMGLAACHSFNPEGNRTMSGAEHFAELLQTEFEAISGTVIFDNVTGTRTPESALFRVVNYIQKPYKGSTTEIEFEHVITDLFLEGEWVNQQPFTFNDGTSNIPADIGLSEEQGTNLFLYVGVPLIVVFLALVALFIFYENKRKQNDSVWKVKREDLIFSEPPEVIGRGTFGLVLLGEYRGTQVAVKRVIPPKTINASDAGKDDNDPSESRHSNPGIRSGVSSSIGGSDSNKTSSMSVVNFGATSMFGKKAMESSALKKLKHDFVEEMRYLSRLRHPCITTVMGAVIDKQEPMLILEYMEHGSLSDLLQNNTVVIDGEILLPILRDITQGVRFLHSADPQVIHGDLKAANILVDSRFRAKVADFGLSQKKQLGGTGTPFWMAPELLRHESANTAATDVYSFGIILYELYSRKAPYDGESASEVLRHVADKKINKRPPTPANMPNPVRAIMSDCVEASPDLRPSFEELDTRLKRIEPAQVDPGQSARKNTVSMTDIFPKKVAEALIAGKTVEPEHRDCVTIFFSDIVGFTNISSTLEPRKIASMLDRLYSKFDKLTHELDIFKVETIGDAYLAVTNLVKDQPDDHAKLIAEFAIEAIQAANGTLIDEDAPEKGFVNIRVGFHSGSVVADVVGTRNPRYCLFGDTVNTASRMESNSVANRIHCSKAAAKLLKKQWKSLPLVSRGRIDIKGKGKMHTFWVNESHDGSENQMSAGKLLASSEFFAPERSSVTATRPSVAALGPDALDALKEESSEFQNSAELLVPVDGGGPSPFE